MMIAFSMIKIKDNNAYMINAGMPPVYHFVKDKNELKEISQHNLPIGAMAANMYKSTETKLSKGDLLIMMSDGFPELQNNEGELYGYPRVSNTLREISAKEPKEIIEALKEDGKHWTNDSPLKDDVTFMVIKVK